MTAAVKVTMTRAVYTTRAGERRIYLYPRATPQPDAEECCRRALHLFPLRRVGKRVWACRGLYGRRFYDSTVQKLIARGLAAIDGDRIVLVGREIRP